MSLSIDSTYIGIVSSRLPLFRALSGNRLYNFRCPICGDSQKNQYKRRAYFYVNKGGGGYSFVCHNCGGSHSLYGFLEVVAPDLLRQYKFENFADRSGKRDGLEMAILFKEEKPEKEVIIDDLIPLDFLPRNHAAVKYILDERKLPKELLEKFLFVEKYVEWLKTTTKEELFYEEHSRILIPFTDGNGDIYRQIARSYDCDISSKYLYTDLKGGSSFYNWYHVDEKKKVYVVEGAIDSMLLDNAIAIGNAKYNRGEFDRFEDYVIVPDNEARSKHIVSAVEKAIEAGHPICIWDKFYGKDINDMWKNGFSKEKIQGIIDKNTVQGLRAKMKFMQWKKI